MCRKYRCKITIIKIIKGRIKCREKNRFKVALLIAKPPQIHITSKLPIYGTVETRFVITVAPQKDICPQGRTYPKKAVAMDIKKIVTPIIHVWDNIEEE
jgi:hypothetical protein